MTYKRFFIAGLCVLAMLGLSALISPTSQAAPRYLIKGSPITTSESITGKGSAILISVPEPSLTVLCTVGTLEGTISIEGRSEAKTTYSKCSVKGATCEISAPVVVKAKGELLAHGEQVYEVLRPSEGETFTVLKFKGSECSLPSEVSVSGTIAGLMEPEEEPTQPIFLSAEIEELICKVLKPCGAKFGASTATIEGLSLPKLNGASKGQEWGAGAVPEFTVAGKPLDVVLQEHKLTSESITAEGGTAKIWAPTYPISHGFIITCNHTSGSGLIEKLGRGLATLNFKECSLTDGEGKKQEGCKVEAVKAETLFLANIPEGGVTSLTFSPPSGEAKDSIIWFTVKGEVCLLLTGERVIRGTTIGKTESSETVSHALTFSEGSGLTYGAYPVYLEASVAFWLGGVSAGQKWGVR